MIHLLAPIFAQAAADTATTMRELTFGEIATGLGLVATMVGLVAGYFSIRRDSRENHDALAKEIRHLIADQEDPQKVSVNQPLSIRPHVEYTPLAVHEKFEAEVNERLAAMSAASSAGRQKIYDLIRSENKGVHDRITDLVRAVARIEGKIERNTNPPHE